MAMIVEPFVSRFIEVLRTAVEEGAAGPSDVRREMRRLRRTLEMVGAVLGAAERKRMQERAINIWVKELKEVMYDADDVIDLYQLEFQKQMPSLEQQAPEPPVCLPFLFPSFRRIARRHEIAIKINDINTRLEEISKRRAMFHLQPEDQKSEDSGVSRRTSPLLSSDVVGVGIDEDTRSLVGLLLEKRKAGNLVFAITGMGGIGKTTLAQKIYNDHMIKDHFEIRLWVLVSQHYSETDLLKGILNYASYDWGNPYGSHTRQQLEEILSQVIQGKRFFLVLDDVWSRDVWEHVLQNPLRSGAPGSRIIVTSRDEGVVKQMGAVYIHPVRLLSDEDSWSLLCKMVFMDEDDGEMEILTDIGMEIVKKCGGLPLALKFAGEILRTKERRQSEWSKVLRNLTWSGTAGPSEEFMGPLYLSYEALPSHLKPCFLYCSLFPENTILARRDLVQLWVAEGFVEPHPRLALEELAEDYYAEIVARSLLQPEAGDLETGEGCRMHDLIRDLALILVEDDSYTGDLRLLQNTTARLHRLSIGSREAIPSPDLITNQKGLRALLIFDNPLKDDVLGEVVDHLLHLRVLDLRGTGIKHVPTNLGNLLHLRYLNLSHTRIKNLPKSIKYLRNLQFLNLNNCKDLQELPKELTQLHNLRSLDLLHSAVDQIPSGVGGMEHLNTLLGFVVTVGDPTLEELKSLNRLRDLYITKLGRARGTEGAELQNKHQLRSLVLSFRDDHPPVADSTDVGIEKILEGLRPPVCLEQLTIECYLGKKYPKWMFSPSDYPNLVRLNLKSCSFCRQLPPLGQLLQLRNLSISASLEIVTVGTEFFGDRDNAFPKLERLVIQEMPKWEEWREPEYRALPLLREMHLNKCPKLRSLPRCLQYSTALTELVIEAADSIRSIEDLVSLTELRLRDCPNLERISNLPALKILKIVKCPLLEDVGEVESLRDLVLVDFALESLPGWLTPNKLMRLQTLDITGNRDLLRSLQKDGPEWHKLAHIPYLYAHSADQTPYFAYSKGKGTFSFNSNLTVTTEQYSGGPSYGEITSQGD